MSIITLNLPEIVIDTHVHGRSPWKTEWRKTTPKQVLSEAIQAGIGISIFQPNTYFPITTGRVYNLYRYILDEACAELNTKHEQRILFGATDSNFQDCREALRDRLVAGTKIYPKMRGGKSVTTGHHIGVSRISVIVKLLELSADTGKPAEFHCEDPLGNHEPEDEIRYIELVLELAREVKRWYGNPKLVICHCSTIKGARLILQAQQEGIDVALEVAPQHLWLNSMQSLYGNPSRGIKKEFFTCNPPLRPEHDQLSLAQFIWEQNVFAMAGSDSACHTEPEKLAGAAGIPSNQELIAVLATLAINNWQHTTTEKSRQNHLARILSWNAADFYDIDVPRKTIPTEFELREDDCVYNHGTVINPWQGQKLYFPVRN